MTGTFRIKTQDERADRQRALRQPLERLDGRLLGKGYCFMPDEGIARRAT